MTKEEYEDCVSKVDSEDIGERLQARMLLAMFPTFETNVEFTEGAMWKLSSVLGAVLDEENQIV